MGERRERRGRGQGGRGEWRDGRRDIERKKSIYELRGILHPNTY